MGVLDILFPKRCVQCKKVGEYVCPSCFATISFDVKNICLVCNTSSIDGLTHPTCRGKYTIDGGWCGVVYTGIVRKLLYQFKYQPYLSGLGEFLADLIYENLIQQESFVRKKHDTSIFVPIPLSISKLRKRGYNQAEILANALGEKYQTPVAAYLIRQRNTHPMYGLKKEERKENMKDAFQVILSRGQESSPRTIFLIDDLLTTGTTLLEAANVLKRKGYQEVYGICFARDI